jgi:hypothetical protein
MISTFNNIMTEPTKRVSLKTPNKKAITCCYPSRNPKFQNSKKNPSQQPSTLDYQQGPKEFLVGDFEYQPNPQTWPASSTKSHYSKQKKV